MKDLDDCEECQKLMKLYLSTNPPAGDKLLELINKYKSL